MPIVTFVSLAVLKTREIEIAETYKAASQNYRHLFDAETGYMRARDSQGNFRPDFSPIVGDATMPNALPSKQL